MGELRKRTYRNKRTGELKESATWTIRYYRNGRRYEESTGTTKKGKALDILKIREGDGAKGLPVTPQMGRLKFDEAVADVISDYRINRKRSLGEVERRARLHLLPYFGGRKMATITTADIRSYVAKRQGDRTSVRAAYDCKLKDGTTRRVPEHVRAIDGVANAEINRELAIIKRAFRLAIQAGKLLQMPHIPLLAEHNVRQGFFERSEFEEVRAKLPAALHGVVTFAFLSGWRIRSEVLPLTWAQVDRHAKTIRLEPGQTKNAEGRTLPYGLLPELHDVIEDQWKAREALKGKDAICPLVFHRDGQAIVEFRGAWVAACEAAGCPGKLLHDFRRTAVRNLVRAGVSERTAMQITGHKTRSVFDRYDIINEADLRDAMGRLADATGAVKGQSARSGRVAKFQRRQNRKVS